VNPFKSTRYDWRGKSIPCDFKRQYTELLLDRSISDPRFINNKDGTVTDSLTGLIWLKNTSRKRLIIQTLYNFFTINCSGLLFNWRKAYLNGTHF